MPCGGSYGYGHATCSKITQNLKWRLTWRNSGYSKSRTCIPKDGNYQETANKIPNWKFTLINNMPTKPRQQNNCCPWLKMIAALQNKQGFAVVKRKLTTAEGKIRRFVGKTSLLIWLVWSQKEPDQSKSKHMLKTCFFVDNVKFCHKMVIESKGETRKSIKLFGSHVPMLSWKASH